MSRLRNISFFLILSCLFILYCWVLKTRPTKNESILFKETNMIPDLTFSRLADLENRMVIELDAISQEDYNNINTENVISQPVQNYGTIQIVVFLSCSLIGVVIVLCLARRYYLQDDYEFDLERIPSTNVLSSHEKLVKSYETDTN